MNDFPCRFFAEPCAIERVGNGLLNASLSRAEWTHEAHIAACCWLIDRSGPVEAAARLPDLIRRLNEANGVVNDDSGGFHATITHCYARSLAAGLARQDRRLPLIDRVNALLGSAEGTRDWPLRFYTRDRLFSVVARRQVVEPDLAPLP